MEMKEALNLCMSGHKVQPTCWHVTNPRHWIIYNDQSQIFLEHGSLEEIPHALRLMTPDEFLGDWEVVE